MSEIPSVPPSSPFSRSPSVTLEEYPDISGNVPVANLSGPTADTQETLPLTKTESLATQAECETPENESESESEDEPEQQVQEDPDSKGGEAGMASIFLFGGLIITAVAFFLSRPINIQHPYSSHDYF